jgi:hypothetical protein
MKKKESKSSKSSVMKKKKNNSSDKFLLKKGKDFFIVNKFLIDTLPFQEALSMAENTYFELKKQLYLDAVHGDHFIQDMKVVEALQRGLEELYSKHPVLQDYVRDQSRFKSIQENTA